jgi:hypothetical protein
MKKLNKLCAISNHINKKVDDQTPNDAHKIFEVFVDDPAKETVSLNTLKKFTENKFTH